MIEKRFTVDDGLENVLCWEINDKENENMTCGECAKLLNELHEEKEYWKEKYKQELEKNSIITVAYDKQGNAHILPKRVD